MYLSGLTIRNVRNITNSTITADKGINVLIGENAAGKTTFLESIDIFVNTVSKAGRIFLSSYIFMLTGNIDR